LAKNIIKLGIIKIMLIKCKKKSKNIIVFVFGFVFLILLSYSIFNIVLWTSDADKTNKQISVIGKIVKKSGIDFDKLKKINADTKGWLKVRGTNIDYPFLQTTNNKFYLSHSFDKSVNQAGWLFMDYRNDINNLSQNTIIYAHARIDGTMFGSMKNVLGQDWYSNKDNHIIEIYSEKQETKWKVFSVYHIITTDDYLQTSFNSTDDFKSFLGLISNRSIHNFNNSTGKNDKILTLSTCYNANEKIVLHAKLISIK